LRNGKLRWRNVKFLGPQMQARLRHGAINVNKEKIFIFGGASSNTFASGHYNDVWTFEQDKYQRVATSSHTPSPKCNFAITEAGGEENNKFFVVGGGRSSISDQPYSAIQAVFEIHSLNTSNGQWTKIQATTSTEPQFSIGTRCVMASHNELLLIYGLVTTFHNFEAMAAEENFHYRSSMQVFILKFTDFSLQRGQWHQLADIQNRRNPLIPAPRVECHLVKMNNDSIFMYGGRSISNNNLQDAWILKISRSPTYSLKFYPVIIENPMVPSLSSHSFPSCVINDLLVFTGVRTALLKKPEVDKTRNNNNNNNNRVNNEPPSTSSASSSSILTNSRQSQDVRKIFINQDRPINTIGAMSAFSVSSSPSISTPHPQKMIKIEATPPVNNQNHVNQKRSLQDYPMRVFCLDLANIFNCDDEMLRSGKLTVRWLSMKKDGLYENAPELRSHSTFTRIDNGIALIGGNKRTSQNDEDDVFLTQATSEVVILTYDEK
jgi:hypothetical protein